MRRILRDLKILILANLWLVPVLAGRVGALFYFVAPPPPMHARLATGAEGGGYHAFAEGGADAASTSPPAPTWPGCRPRPSSITTPT